MRENQKKAVVVSLHDDISEILQLAESLDYSVIKTFIQRRNNPDVNSYIGSGKVGEVREFIEGFGDVVDTVIIDGALKPSQWFTLEKRLDVEVFDRIRLILSIFEKRADRKEARLQVRLAQLHYERPFVRELIHRARAGEHPGFMAGGGYQVDDYYEMIKKQAKKIKEDLSRIRYEREIRRRHRHKGGFYLVSLAGYTNAGKSSLLNLLSAGKVKVEGRLFSTLSTTTRKITRDHLPILLTDTVGFIQDLPTWIIDAFHSTLEELTVADVVLLLVDASEEKELIAKKLDTSFHELREIGGSAATIIVLNKIDLLSNTEMSSRVEYLRDQGLITDKKVVSISIKNRENIDVLLDVIHESLPRLCRLTIKVPSNEKAQAFIAWMYEKASIASIDYNDFITVSLQCNQMIKDKIISKSHQLHGEVIHGQKNYF